MFIDILMLQGNDTMDPDDVISDDIHVLGDDPDDDSLEPTDECAESDNEGDQFLSDGEADADALASCGFGTDEDYGCYNSCDE